MRRTSDEFPPSRGRLHPDPAPGEKADPDNKPDLGFKDHCKAWYQASRPPFYVATLIPLILGLVLAHKLTGEWRLGRFLLLNLGAFMVHLATNLANDLFDHALGADAGESIGGSRVIQQ
ncbi:MAG: prenyltransferase, partial [Pseudomonadota bacterium]